MSHTYSNVANVTQLKNVLLIVINHLTESWLVALFLLRVLREALGRV